MVMALQISLVEWIDPILYFWVETGEKCHGSTHLIKFAGRIKPDF